ncbi:hypothetical protein CLF_100603 [Clonorchis sinensis]|uniref:Uncharacterized protein n=1 Tax=Clonorchis sinensis TaxID=79923 RepID=G7Y3U2_CLOSI|nr:hypothetical protein CLF_100603 [Clonorchis sinensis]
MAKPIIVMAPCAPENTPMQPAVNTDCSFYSITADPSTIKGSDAREEASLVWTHRPKPHRDTLLIKPCQKAQEIKQTHAYSESFNNSKFSRPKGGTERATSSSGRNFAHVGKTTSFEVVLSATTPAPFCDALWIQISLHGSDALLFGVVCRRPSSPSEDNQFLKRTLEQLPFRYCFTHILLHYAPDKALITSPRLVMKRLQSNCLAQRTNQGSSTLPELPTLFSIANLIERGQRAATKMVAGLKSMDYERRLVVHDLFPLECRRFRGDLIHTFALFEQGERQPLNDKNKTYPENLDEGLDPVYHFVNPLWANTVPMPSPATGVSPAAGFDALLLNTVTYRALVKVATIVKSRREPMDQQTRLPTLANGRPPFENLSFGTSVSPTELALAVTESYKHLLKIQTEKGIKVTSSEQDWVTCAEISSKVHRHIRSKHSPRLGTVQEPTSTGQFARMNLALMVSPHEAAVTKEVVKGSCGTWKLPTYSSHPPKAASPIMNPAVTDDTEAQIHQSDNTVSEGECLQSNKLLDLMYSSMVIGHLKSATKMNAPSWLHPTYERQT